VPGGVATVAAVVDGAADREFGVVVFDKEVLVVEDVDAEVCDGVAPTFAVPTVLVISGDIINAEARLKFAHGFEVGGDEFGHAIGDVAGYYDNVRFKGVGFADNFGDIASRKGVSDVDVGEVHDSEAIKLFWETAETEIRRAQDAFAGGSSRNGRADRGGTEDS